MSERDHYPAGVPCWTSALQRDVTAARGFYEGLFGWTTHAPEDDDSYAVARLRGRDVAGIGTMPESAGDAPAAWVTEVRVDDVDAAMDRVSAAGGTVVQSPVDFTPIGRLGVFTDPAGAVLCAWEAGRRQGAQVVNEPSAWAMSALSTPDPEGALAFYGAVFGWRPEPFGPITLWRVPGYFGGEPSQPVPRDVVAAMLPGDAPARWAVDFWIADADAAARTAEELGGAVLEPPHDAPPFRQARLADPEGAEFTVSQLVAPPS
jgi:predicted enzyme related to lactoylglutathione lyase